MKYKLIIAFLLRWNRGEAKQKQNKMLNTKKTKKQNVRYPLGQSRYLSGKTKQTKQVYNCFFLLLGFGIWNFGLETSFAQPYVHQVIFLNEGHYDYTNQIQTVPVTIGSYSPSTQIYTVVDTIANARFGSDVIIDGQSIYVAADSFIVKYDKDTYQQTGIQVVQGIRKLAVWNNQLLVSRGDAMPFGSYLQVYDKNSLSFIYELDTVTGPKFSSEGIAIYNDSAYLAVNNAFEWGNEKGLLGIIDLSNQNYVTEIDLGPDGKNPDNIMRDGNMIYTLNNKDWSGSSITTFNANDRTNNTVNVAIVSGCGTSAFAVNFVYYQEYSLNQLARFDVNTQTVFDTLNGTLSYYGLLDDTINSVLYATSTDYVSSGDAYIMQYDGTMLDTFAVGVSPGNMALDVRTLTSVEQQNNSSQIIFYPNPVASELNVQFSEKGNYVLTIYNMLGEVVYNSTVSGAIKIPVSEFSPGMYYLKAGTSSGKFIKQ